MIAPARSPRFHHPTPFRLHGPFPLWSIRQPRLLRLLVSPPSPEPWPSSESTLVTSESSCPMDYPEGCSCSQASRVQAGIDDAGGVDTRARVRHEEACQHPIRVGDVRWMRDRGSPRRARRQHARCVDRHPAQVWIVDRAHLACHYSASLRPIRTDREPVARAHAPDGPVHASYSATGGSQPQLLGDVPGS